MHLLLALGACTPEEPPPPTLVVETEVPTRPWVDSGIFRPRDTASVTLGNDVPDAVIAIEHRGWWERSGTPYDAMVGRLEVLERINGYVPDTSDTGDTLDCDVGYFLTGTPADGNSGCPDCGPAWRVTFTVDPTSISGLEPCRDPELPRDEETWLLSMNDVEGMIYANYYGSGVWLPWWPAVSDGDRIDYGWIGELAIDLPDEEDE
jgi:hypothetical protein